MNRSRFASFVAVTTVTALAVLAPTAPAAARANAVTRWNQIAVETLLAFPLPGGGAPPASQIHMGMVQGAVYDAVNAIKPRRFEPYLLDRTFPSYASKRAAAAQAAYDVLSDIIATVPAAISFPNETDLQQRLDDELATFLGAIPEGRSKTAGIAAGVAAAEAMKEARADDGRFGPSQWVPNSAPGHWQPLVDPATGRAVLDPTPWVGGVDPFLMTSSSQFRTAGPNALTSDAYAREFNEVKRLGALNSTARTAEQTHIATFWQSSPIANWNAVGRTLAADPRYHLGVVQTARLLAYQNLSGADAHINCWNDKYHWDFWRPWNAIPRAEEDGNDATVADPSWTPLLTAPYPDHPSGHLCTDGAHLKVLRTFFGDRVEFSVTSVRFPDEIRTYDRFSAALSEIIDARIWAGLHFRTADVQAERLGRSVAQYAMGKYLEPIG